MLETRLFEEHASTPAENGPSLIEELAAPTPTPGGGSAAAYAGAMGAGLVAMEAGLTIGKKKYADVETQMKSILAQSEDLRTKFTKLVADDTAAFNKVMEAYALPKETEPQKALRAAAAHGATKEATLVPLEVMKHCIDGLALAQIVAAQGNVNSVSDAGVGALMLHAACESAALNVKINLGAVGESEFVGWKQEELESILKTSRMMVDEVQGIVGSRMEKN